LSCGAFDAGGTFDCRPATYDIWRVGHREPPPPYLLPCGFACSCYSRATMDGVVVGLNQNYEPLNVCNLPRAFRLLFGEKAEVIEFDHQVIRTVRTEFRAPSVIRLQHMVRRPRPRVKLSRREVFARDRHTCQYCGRQTHDLTLDHVVPRHRGGGHSWENLVTACKTCNHRKGGKTLDEARLRLHRDPFEPRSDIYSLFTPYLADDRNDAWRSYLFLGRN
jgi:5-methylcytosine-specific restriction endonuclease McrA